MCVSESAEFRFDVVFLILLMYFLMSVSDLFRVGSIGANCRAKDG
jgi:hypothetical protein